MTKKNEPENPVINTDGGNYNESIGGHYVEAGRDFNQISGDYIKYIVNNTRHGNWGKVITALLPFLLLGVLSGGVGFGGGIAVENHRIRPQIQDAQEKVTKANSENTDLKKNMRSSQNSSLQELNDLKVKLSGSEKNLKDLQFKFDTVNSQLNETQKALTAAKAKLRQIPNDTPNNLSGSWELKFLPHNCEKKYTAGFSQIQGIICKRTSDNPVTNQLVINQTGGEFTVETDSSIPVKKGGITPDGTFIATGTDVDDVKTVLKGKLNNSNTQISGIFYILKSGYQLYESPFTMKRL
ncbi:hypothetical protein H6G64_35450 [Calothrix sp. FACHB-156]|nr:hypothetical protein [Calothrix sp. FACHB-156]